MSIGVGTGINIEVEIRLGNNKDTTCWSLTVLIRSLKVRSEGILSKGSSTRGPGKSRRVGWSLRGLEPGL